MPNFKKIVKGSLAGQEIDIEGLWQDVAGQSWMFMKGNPACLIYAMRSASEKLPTDDNVYYGKIKGNGHLVHGSELQDEESI